MADRWTLLTFCRNDGERAVENLARLREAVDEFVVVDSSDPPAAARLAAQVADRGGRVVRVVPLGNVDLLRPFGVAQVRTERTVYLDADERPSAPLREGIRTLDRSDAYVLPRRESDLGVTTEHLRVFRTSAVAYRGPSHGFPWVQGRTDRAPTGMFLEHRADYSRYFLDRRDRIRSYVLSEWIERPFDRTHLRDDLTWRAGRGSVSLMPVPRRSGDRQPLCGPGLRLGPAVTGVRESLTRGSLRWGRFQRAYARSVTDAWTGLTATERADWGAIAEEVRAVGGLRRYLGLDDFDYVRDLTASFPWDRTAPSVLAELIHHRHRTGGRRPPGGWGAPLPENGASRPGPEGSSGPSR